MIVAGAGETEAARRQEEVRREQAVRREKQQRKQLRINQGTGRKWGKAGGVIRGSGEFWLLKTGTGCLDPILKVVLFKQGFVAYFNPDIVFPRIRNGYLVNFIPDLISLDLRLPDPHR